LREFVTRAKSRLAVCGKTLSGRHFEVCCDMESLFLLAFGDEEFLAALAMASSEAFFNELLVA
jgi:hypothetical protein